MDRQLGSLDTRGTGVSYKHPRTTSNKTSSNVLFKIYQSEINPLTGRQHGSSYISSEDGGNSQFNTSKIVQRNMGLHPPMGCHNHSRVPPKQIEFDCGQGISPEGRFLGVEIVSPSFSEDMSQDKELSGNRLVCLQDLPSSSKLCSLETGPIQSIYNNNNNNNNNIFIYSRLNGRTIYPLYKYKYTKNN